MTENYLDPTPQPPERKYINDIGSPGDTRILQGPPRWQKARESFKELCEARGVNPKEYGQIFKRSPAELIEAILSDDYDEEEYFRTPEERRKNAFERIDKMLTEQGIKPETYEKEFGHKKTDLYYLILLGQDLDLAYWCSPKNVNNYKEAEELFDSMCQERGVDSESYQYEYRIKKSDAYKYIHRYCAEIRAGDPVVLGKVEERVFTKNSDPKRTKEWIFEEAKKCVPKGRTAGLTMYELGKIKTLAKSFYPGGMSAINADLGLEQTVNIPDYQQARRDAPTVAEMRIEEVNRKIERICEQLNPVRLGKLQDELQSLRYDSDKLQGDEYDAGILQRLESEIDKSLVLEPGFLYFKQWALPEATWFKIGVTNSPSRREAEQNVLPVPSQTLYLLRLDSMGHARAVEKAFHRVLESKRIQGAMNRELFQLSPKDYGAVLVALKNLSDRVSQPELED